MPRTSKKNNLASLTSATTKAEKNRLITGEMQDNWRYTFTGERQAIYDRIEAAKNVEVAVIEALDEVLNGVPREDKYEYGVAGLLDKIDKRRAKVIYDHIFEGKSFSEIGDEMNVSKQRVHQLFLLGVGDLQKYCSANELTRYSFE